MPVSDVPPSGSCFHCGVHCTADDYCYGCKTLICARCSPYYEGPGGPSHVPSDHLLYLEPVAPDATCRYVVGRERVSEAAERLYLCGRPAHCSAYCLAHLHVVLDERSGGRRSQ